MRGPHRVLILVCPSNTFGCPGTQIADPARGELLNAIREKCILREVELPSAIVVSLIRGSLRG